MLNPVPRADVGAEREPHAVLDDGGASGTCRCRRTRCSTGSARRVAPARGEPPELAVGRVHVVGEHRAGADEAEALVRVEVVAALGTRRDGRDLARVLVDVDVKSRPARPASVRRTRASPRCSDREARRHRVAQPAAAVPPRRRARRSGCRSRRGGCSVGERLRSGRRDRLRFAGPHLGGGNSASCAAAKCEPKTRAVVVPFACERRTNVRRSRSAYARSASRASWGSACARATRAAAAHRADDGSWGKCTCASTSRGEQRVARVEHVVSRMRGAHLRPRADLRHMSVADG